jgi:protein-tyrosine phosphatase
MKVLFVCLGNICRSPTAEAVLKYQLAEAGIKDVQVDSAGTAAYHIGSSPDPRAIKAGRLRGYDLSGLRARQIQPEDFVLFDLILAMDENNLSNILNVKPEHSISSIHLASDFSELTFKNVPDPYYGDSSDFKEVIDLCESIAQGVIAHYRQRLKND